MRYLRKTWKQSGHLISSPLMFVDCLSSLLIFFPVVVCQVSLIVYNLCDDINNNNKSFVMWIIVLKWNAINKWMTLIFAEKMVFSRLIRACSIQKVKAGRSKINSRSFWNTYYFKNSISMKPCLQKKCFHSSLCKSAKQFQVRIIIKLTVRTERIKVIE